MLHFGGPLPPFSGHAHAPIGLQHVHLISFQTLGYAPFDVDGYLRTGVVTETGPLVPPDPWQQGWKDVVATPLGSVTKIIVTFDRPGPYMYHCHILGRWQR